MSELKRLPVLFVAFVAFLLAGYIQAGGEWRGSHSLRKSIHPNGGTIGLQDAHSLSEVARGISDQPGLQKPPSPGLTSGLPRVVAGHLMKEVVN
jgi:hypothetical protein